MRKETKSKTSTSKTSGASKTATATGTSSQGNRAGAKGTNTKEAFLKKLKLCSQNFDYKDEAKDAKGKTDRL
jgi:hypothetical protein